MTIYCRGSLSEDVLVSELEKKPLSQLALNTKLPSPTEEEAELAQKKDSPRISESPKVSKYLEMGKGHVHVGACIESRLLGFSLSLSIISLLGHIQRAGVCTCICMYQGSGYTS